MPTKTKTNTKTNTRKTSRNAGKKNAQSTVEKLLKLKAQSDRLNERMKAMKEELYPLLKESGKLSCEFGDISLKISNSWILPPSMLLGQGKFWENHFWFTSLINRVLEFSKLLRTW